MDVGEFTRRSLSESGGGNKGLADLWTLKMHLRKYLLQNHLDAQPDACSEVKAQIRDLLADHASLRKVFPLGEVPDLTWQSSWKDLIPCSPIANDMNRCFYIMALLIVA